MDVPEPAPAGPESMDRRAVVVEVAPLEPFLAGVACLRLAPGATVAQALAMLGITPPAGIVAAVWGRAVGGAQRLHPGDRIEFTRPLATDPKAARRARLRSARR